jgi:hypothetical protein
MPKILGLVLVCAGLSLATGCKKKHYSSNCSKAVDLVAPWNAMKLPTGEGDGRVCMSNDVKTDIEHLSGDEAAWEAKYEAAVVAQGYTKERCSNLSCTFNKAGEKLTVHANQVATGKRNKTIVHLSRQPSKDAPATDPAAATAGPAGAGTGSAP